MSRACSPISHTLVLYMLMLMLMLVPMLTLALPLELCKDREHAQESLIS